MPKGSFAKMQAEAEGTQISFCYENGQVETFALPISATDLAQTLPQLLSQPWITLHLIDQTVVICMTKVSKVEIKPPIPQLQGEASFPNSQRITALQRGAVGRLGI
jgi:hypothetical protein